MIDNQGKPPEISEERVNHNTRRPMENSHTKTQSSQVKDFKTSMQNRVVSIQNQTQNNQTVGSRGMSGFAIREALESLEAFSKRVKRMREVLEKFENSYVDMMSELHESIPKEMAKRFDRDFAEDSIGYIKALGVRIDDEDIPKISKAIADLERLADDWDY